MMPSRTLVSMAAPQASSTIVKRSVPTLVDAKYRRLARNPNGWSAPTVGAIVGVNKRTVLAWAHEGFVCPTMDWLGPVPMYRLADAVALRVAKDLLDARLDRLLVRLLVAEINGP